MWEFGFVRREKVVCCWTLAIAAAAYWIQTCNRKPAVFEMLDSERRRMVVSSPEETRDAPQQADNRRKS
jgi:hypothetical protein